MNRTVVAVVALLIGFLPASALRAAEIRAHCPAPASDAYYFAPGAFFAAGDDRDAFVRNWYSEVLRAASEPSLSCEPEPGAVVYRFTWLRTFHHPVIVRVVARSDGMRLVGIELDGAGGYKPGNVSRRVDRRLKKKEADALLAEIEAIPFWTIAASENTTGARDGAEWIIEGARAGSYRIVVRWSPSEGTVRGLGLSLLGLAGLLPASDIY